MKITLSYEKTLDQNASAYFQKAKEARQKQERVKETIASFEKKAAKAKAQQATDFESSYKKIDTHKKRWYEKFKWTITSEGFLIIAGRDVTSNEIIIKKHTESGDLVFHTDMAGSPFVVIKKKSQEDVAKLFEITQPASIGAQSIQEAANFTLVHSKAWKTGLSTTEVFYVTPDQVTKEAQSGESLSRGSFVIRGKTTYVPVLMDFAVGLVEAKETFLLSGPENLVETFTSKRVLVTQGKEKTSQVAKAIRLRLRETTEIDVEIDELVRLLPSGGCQIKKERKPKH